MNIAYHWKRKATPILCIATGISRTASRDVLDGGAEALGGRLDLGEDLRRRLELLRAEHRDQHRDQDDDRADHEAAYIQYGTPLPALPTITFCRMNRDRFASTAPAPVNMLWVRNPRATCESGSRSDSSAR